MNSSTATERWAKFFDQFTPTPRVNVMLSILIFQLIVAGMVGASIEANDGLWIYPSDGAYVNLTLARNLAETGVMGLNRGEFSAASSTPLYTLLLAAIFKFTSWREYVPLSVNVLAAAGVLGAASALLTKLGVGPWRSLVALLALVIATPLPTLAASGMEHTLQILATLLFVSAFLAGSRLLPIAALLMVGLRYENAGLVVIAVAILGWRRDWKSAARTIAGAIVVPSAMALASWANGWPLIPASILINASMRHPDPWVRLLDPAGFKAIRNLISAPHLLALLAALFAGLKSHPAIAGSAVAAILIQVQFGGTGSLFRYEAYVVALAIVAVAALPGVRPRTAALLLLLPLCWRGHQSVVAAINDSASHYGAPYQMARFFRDHYPRVAVAIHDAGAVNFLGHVKAVDLNGLGNREILDVRLRTGELHPSRTNRILQNEGVRVAALYESQHPKGLGGSWRRVGSWRTPSHYGGSDRLHFYAPSEAEASELQSKLRQYWPRLPDRVVAER